MRCLPSCSGLLACSHTSQAAKAQAVVCPRIEEGNAQGGNPPADLPPFNKKLASQPQPTPKELPSGKEDVLGTAAPDPSPPAGPPAEEASMVSAGGGAEETRKGAHTSARDSTSEGGAAETSFPFTSSPPTERLAGGEKETGEQAPEALVEAAGEGRGDAEGDGDPARRFGLNHDATERPSSRAVPPTMEQATGRLVGGADNEVEDCGGSASRACGKGPNENSTRTEILERSVAREEKEVPNLQATEESTADAHKIAGGGGDKAGADAERGTACEKPTSEV